RFVGLLAARTCRPLPEQAMNLPLAKLRFVGPVTARRVFSNPLTGLSGIQREKLLRLCNPAQRVAADRYETAAHAIDIGEGLRNQHRLLDRATHSVDPTRFVNCRPDYGEIQSFGATDIAIEHLADVQAEIHVGDRPLVAGAPCV